MNALFLEKPTPANLAAVPEIGRGEREKKEAEISRLPVAAGLLPYGLSLASLLHPKS